MNLNSNAEGEARNLNIYTYNKGKVKKIWSTSDQIIAYNKKQKTIAGLQYSVLSENGSEREKYYIYKYNGKKIVKKHHISLNVKDISKMRMEIKLQQI